MCWSEFLHHARWNCVTSKEHQRTRQVFLDVDAEMETSLCLYFFLTIWLKQFNQAEKKKKKKCDDFEKLPQHQRISSFHSQQYARKAEDQWLNGKKKKKENSCRHRYRTVISVSRHRLSFIPLPLRGEADTHENTHSQNTPLYLQKAWGRQSAWISSRSAYIFYSCLPNC